MWPCFEGLFVSRACLYTYSFFPSFFFFLSSSKSDRPVNTARPAQGHWYLSQGWNCPLTLPLCLWLTCNDVIKSISVMGIFLMSSPELYVLFTNINYIHVLYKHQMMICVCTQGSVNNRNKSNVCVCVQGEKSEIHALQKKKKKFFWPTKRFTNKMFYMWQLFILYLLC